MGLGRQTFTLSSSSLGMADENSHVQRSLHTAGLLQQAGTKPINASVVLWPHVCKGLISQEAYITRTGQLSLLLPRQAFWLSVHVNPSRTLLDRNLTFFLPCIYYGLAWSAMTRSNTRQLCSNYHTASLFIFNATELFPLNSWKVAPASSSCHFEMFHSRPPSSTTILSQVTLSYRKLEGWRENKLLLPQSKVEFVLCCPMKQTFLSRLTLNTD